ncbi:MAG: DUF3786 domain-containing protein [Deltaproteobacteria bacterium]|nr:DUF3786 domain-containing protein [Deltaproteobacteria bacterium]
MRVDDYKNALALAAKELLERPPNEVAQLSGANLDGSLLKFSFMNRELVVSTLSYVVAWANQNPDEEFALTDAVMVLHYLQGAKGVKPTGEYVAYRQIQGGEFYTAAFRKRAELPLIGTFGTKPGLLTKTAALLGGQIKEGMGDEAAIFRVLPNIDIVTIIHQGDEEFPPEGQVLFDKSISEALSIEDVAWVGSALVYRLMAASKKITQ